MEKITSQLGGEVGGLFLSIDQVFKNVQSGHDFAGTAGERCHAMLSNTEEKPIQVYIEEARDIVGQYRGESWSLIFIHDMKASRHIPITGGNIGVMEETAKEVKEKAERRAHLAQRILFVGKTPEESKVRGAPPA